MLVYSARKNIATSFRCIPYEILQQVPIPLPKYQGRAVNFGYRRNKIDQECHRLRKKQTKVLPAIPQSLPCSGAGYHNYG